MKKKILKRVVLSILGVIVICFAILGFMFKDEIITISKIKKVDNYPLYETQYDADYGFDKFLKQGASNDGELVQFVSQQLLKGLPIKINVPQLGCSTFNAQTPDGQKIFGRNFDLNYSPSMLVHTAPKNGYKSISMISLGFVGLKKNNVNSIKGKVLSLVAPYIPLDGVNEKGVSIGVLLLPDKPTDQRTDKIDITTTTAIRMILDKAKNVDEAISLLKKYDMHASVSGTYHFQIADASGKSVIVEYIHNKMKVLNPSKKYQYATNFYLSPEMNKKGNGQDRYAVLKKELDTNNGIMTQNQAMNLLKKVHKDKVERKKHVFIGDSDTQWSSLYNNSKRSVNIAIHGNYKKIYHFNVK